MAPIIVDLMTFLDDFMVFLEASEAFRISKAMVIVNSFMDVLIGR
jgi:hypothetical protein